MGKEIKVRVVMRHNTTGGWQTVEDSAVLLKGEIGFEFTSSSNVPKMKIGDGRRPWKGLDYFTAALPENYTWGDLYGTVYKNETTYDDVFVGEEQLQLKYPAYTDTVNIKDINKNFSTLNKKITDDIETQITIIKEQISKFIGGWSEDDELASGTISQEIIDARRRFSNDREYNSVGEAIRAIDADLATLTAQMAEFVGASAVDGLYYEGNKLWVASGGQPIGDPVEIVSGGGSGGDGGSSSFTPRIVNLLESRNFSIASSEKAIIEYTYTSKDSEGYTDGAGVGTLYVGGIKKITFSVPQGENSIDVASYLATGANTVKLQVTNSENRSASITYTITVVALSLTTTFPDMGLYTGRVSFPYTLTGSGDKQIFFFLDGEQIGKERVSTSGRTNTFTVEAQKDGGHILEAYAEVDVSTMTTVRSNTLRVGMLWYSSSMTESAILINNTTEKATQGELISIPYLVYTPNISETEIRLTIVDEDGNTYSEKTISVDGTAKVWNTQDFPAGNTIFRISAGGVYAETTIQIAASTFMKDIVTEGLRLEFSAKGRSNSEENPEYWSYELINDYGDSEGIVEAEFEGFGWANVDGWYDTNSQTVLRFLPGDTMKIKYYPFSSQNIKSSGFTVEMELATHDVKDAETVLLTSYQDGKGLIVQASSAQISASASSISTRFREDSQIRVAFTIEPQNSETKKGFIFIYVNGVMSGVTEYTQLDDFTQDNFLTIGTKDSGLDLYTLRFYNRALSTEEQLNNFICDRATLAERIKVDEANDIFNEDGDITIDTLPPSIPYFILECEELPQFKGDKKKNKSVTFVDKLNPERSFTAQGVVLNVQGTSSQGYPRKNYKVQLKEGITYTESNTSSVGFPIFDGGIAGENICLKADFASSEMANNVMLTDYYESLTPFDTQNGVAIPYPPTIENDTDPGYIGFIDSRCRRAIRGFACVVFWKNTTTNEISFIGRYNANDDKSNENVFGFDRNVNPATECWEFKNNTSNRVIFKEANFFEGEDKATDWKEGTAYNAGDIVINKYPYTSLINNNTAEPGTDESAWSRIPYNEDITSDFEPRFPDIEPVYEDYSALCRIMRWVVSTDRDAATGNTLSSPVTYGGVEYTNDTAEYRLAKFTNEFTQYFVKDAMLFYYIFTEVFLMVDNRAKNLFLTTFDGIKWFPVPYDFDTACGIL